MVQAVLIILKHSALQFLGLFGVLFISGLLLTWISKWTNNIFRQFLAPKFGLYFFGTIGVPLHELCHAIFAKLFLHEIGSIKWFDPSAKDGSYGAVTHHYSERNVYHRIGLFFIGLGPVLLAPVFLYGFYRLCLPHPLSFSLQWGDLGFIASHFAKSLIGASNWTSWGFYVFLYLAMCLTSQMELSPEDLKVARGGVLPAVVLLILINTLSYAFQLKFHSKMVLWFKTGFAWWGAFLAMAVVIAVLNFVLCYFVFNIINRVCGKEGINPFQEE